MIDTAQFFDGYYNNVEVNAILIFDINGVILDVNKSFTNHFGYKSEELEGKHFSILFNEQDIKDKKPERELQEVLEKGQAQDENYVVDKVGHQIFCTGESVLVSTRKGEKYVVKDIINLQSEKQVQFFLKDTHELLLQMFNYSKGIAMMILNARLKIEDINTEFLKIFRLAEAPAPGTRLSNLGHQFWEDTALRNEISLVFVHNQTTWNKDFGFTTPEGEKTILRLNSRLMAQPDTDERKLFILIRQLPVKSN